MNYPYWKDREDTERTTLGVEARQLFYEATLAYRYAKLETAVKKFREGLDVWDKLLADHQSYRNDDFNLKDTGLIVKRYIRALRQLGEPEPKEYPFMDLYAAAEQDTSVDPFDAIEMMGVSKPATNGVVNSRAIPVPVPITPEVIDAPPASPK